MIAAQGVQNSLPYELDTQGIRLLSHTLRPIQTRGLLTRVSVVCVLCSTNDAASRMPLLPHSSVVLLSSNSHETQGSLQESSLQAQVPEGSHLVACVAVAGS